MHAPPLGEAAPEGYSGEGSSGTAAVSAEASGSVAAGAAIFAK
jgi:hypothetical protein